MSKIRHGALEWLGITALAFVCIFCSILCLLVLGVDWAKKLIQVK